MTWLLVLFLVAWPGMAIDSAAACEPVGAIRFICGPIGPEDLAVVPGGEWVVASGNQPGGRIHLVSIRDKTTRVLFPTPDRRQRFDAATYPGCPGPLDPASDPDFRAHGLYLQRGAASVHSLYVVHHGTRESVEIFELDARGAQPSLTWVGCAVAPPHLGLNAVVALPGGGFAASSIRTGDVWSWDRNSGWAQIPGSAESAANGVEISADGRWLYIAGWSQQKITRLSLGRGDIQKEVVPMPFRPDNLRWSADGSFLLAAGHGDYQTPKESSNVARIDPQTLRVDHIFNHPSIPGFAVSTAAIQIGEDLWLGSNRGEMIAYLPMPR